MEKIKEHFDVILAVSAALLAIGTAFESWVGLPLLLRLGFIALMGIFIFWTVSARFLPDVPEANVGFGPPTARPANLPKKKWAQAAFAFFLSSCAVVVLAWLSTERLAVVATTNKQDDGIYLRLEAADLETDVIVSLKGNCEYKELSAKVIRVNETRPNEQLQIFGFSGGQAVEVFCDSGRLFDARDIEIRKGDASLMFSEVRIILRSVIVVGGFFLWIFGLLRLRAL